MSAAVRLLRARGSARFAVPGAGSIGVWGARLGELDPALPRERLLVVQGFRPWHDKLRAAGIEAVRAARGPVALAIVLAARARAASLGRIAEALRALPPGGLLVVDGQKTDGIEPLQRACRAVAEPEAMLTKAHGRLFVLRRPAALPDAVEDWAAGAAPQRGADGLWRRAGGFAADGPDPGSDLLVAHLPPLAGRVADLGAGCGALSLAVLRSAAVTGVDLVEADHAALEDARANVADPRAHFLWEDAAHWRPETRHDAVVCNPPFHAGRAAEPELGLAFIRTAAALLAPQGTFWMVANRRLPYERGLGEAFAEVRPLADARGFKVIRAARPRLSGSGRRMQRE